MRNWNTPQIEKVLEYNFRGLLNEDFYYCFVEMLEKKALQRTKKKSVAKNGMEDPAT